MQRTLIINPPAEAGFDRSGRWPAKSMGGTFIEPLFLAYAAAVLEKECLPVELIDCRPFYISQKELLKRFDNDVILAVLQTSTPSIYWDMDTAKKIKDNFPGVKIALVGPHVSALDREIMEKEKYIDFIAKGEYDYTIGDLVKTLIFGGDLTKVLGITFRNGVGVISNPPRPYVENLDELPLPARHLLPMRTYFDPMFKSKMTFRLMGSRGCPYRCTFCLWPQTMHGRKIRFRDPKKIVDEIEYFINNQGARSFYFEDDTLTVNPKYVTELCDEIIRRKVNKAWSCLGRVDNLTEEMLVKMKQAGCYMIRFGPESSSQKILNNVRKGFTVEQMVKGFELCRKTGIRAFASYVLGLPGETKETLEETLRFAIKMDHFAVQFGMAVPYPGTEMYDEAVKNGWLKTTDWEKFNAAEDSVLEYPGLKAEEIAKFALAAHLRFYFRPRYVIKRIAQLQSFDELIQLVKGTITLVVRLVKDKLPNVIR